MLTRPKESPPSWIAQPRDPGDEVALPSINVVEVSGNKELAFNGLKRSRSSLGSVAFDPFSRFLFSSVSKGIRCDWWISIHFVIAVGFCFSRSVDCQRTNV